MSGSPETTHRWGLSRAFSRSFFLISALTVLILAIAVACGGGDDGESDDDNMDVVMSTFTPTSEADAANREATRAAEEESANATATAVAEITPEPTATRDPNAPTQVVPTVDPELAEGLRPPRVWLDDGNTQMEGVLGNFSLVDLDTGTVANIMAPFYDVGDEGLTVSAGGELELILEEDVESPTSMTGEPESVTVEVYTWEENNAIPTGTDGSVEDHPWFVPAVPPVITSPVDLNSPVFTMPATPDRYVVRVNVEWPTGSEEENPPQLPIFAMYAFTVYVE